MASGSLFVVMGVSGCGKTVMSQLLAQAAGGDWLDADDFHSDENKARMARGLPLTDDDRGPWLDRLNAELRRAAGRGRPLFLACSALKQKYRDRLITGLPQIRFVYLKGSIEVVRSRLARRPNHFMPAALLESQFATLEEPKDAIVLDITRTPRQMVDDFEKLA